MKTGTVSRTILRPDGVLSAGEQCWRVDPGDILQVLCREPGEGWSASARLWAKATRSALRMIADGRVRPGLIEAEGPTERYATWVIDASDALVQSSILELADELAGLPRCTNERPGGMLSAESIDPATTVHRFLDGVAGWFIPSPGLKFLHGSAPFTGLGAIDDTDAVAAIQRWIDTIDDGCDSTEDGLIVVLALCAPEAGCSTVEGSVRLKHVDTANTVDAEQVWARTEDSPVSSPRLRDRVRRRLRQAGELIPVLEIVGADRDPARFRLDQIDVAKLRGSACDELRSLGIEVAWEADWVHVTAEAVVSSRTDPTQITGRFGLGELLDRRWRYLADNIEIDPAVLTQLRAAELPWIMHHNKWILVDDITREKLLAKWTEEIPVPQGMLEVLSGWVTIDGRSFRCTPVGGLAALLDELRRTDHAAAVAQARRECPIDLYPHQATALAWLLRLADLGFNGLLADDMGLGKTITALAFHLSRRRQDSGKPTLVVAPNWPLIKKWEADIEQFAPGTVVLLYRGPNRSLDPVRRGNCIVLTSYKLVEQGDAGLQDQQWGLVIADEAQEIKNPATFKSRNMRQLRTPARLALTGTPVENHAGELRAILDWCNPGLFGTAAQFHTRCVRPIEDATDSTTREAARQSAHDVVRPFLTRRCKDDPSLGFTLPDLHEYTHSIPLSDCQIGLLDALDHDSRQQLRACSDSPAKGRLAHHVIHSQRKIANSPSHYRGDKLDEVAADLAQVEFESPKLPTLRTLLESIRAAGEAALVFTCYRYPAHLIKVYLAAHKFSTCVYDGHVPPSERTTMVEDMANGRTDVFIATIGTAGVGLDLTRANHVILYERHWNPAVEAQAISRVHRMNQTLSVYVHNLVTANSIEERIEKLVNQKRGLPELFLPDGDIDFDKFTVAELAALANLYRS